MIQMHNERSNAISLHQALELNRRWWRWIKNEEIGEIAKRGRKSMFFNFAQSCEMKQNGFWLQHTKGKVKKQFRMTMRNFRTVMRNALERRK